jgi:adenylylsulfate kinase
MFTLIQKARGSWLETRSRPLTAFPYLRAMLIQLTGLSGAGKTTIAKEVKTALDAAGHSTIIIDGDVYRQTLCKDLGFSKEDRQENIRRLGKLANEHAQEGSIAIVAAINPYEAIRQELVALYDAKTVWIDCSLEELIRRDTKGLYKRALLPDNDPNKLTNLTGVNDLFEQPVHANLILHTSEETIAESVQKLYSFIISRA